jgi:uncharacterized OsmC-like protein
VRYAGERPEHPALGASPAQPHAWRCTGARSHTRDARGTLQFMEPVSSFHLQVEQIDAFEFRVRFDKEQYEDLRMDEPAPLGKDSAPNPARILAAAIGNCLAASLVFCLKRKGIVAHGVRSELQVTLARNEHKRLRVVRVDVKLHASDIPKDALDACRSTFEDFCVVTQSVREGIEVNVDVLSV